VGFEASGNQKHRIVGYDVAKALAMFLVVAIHYAYFSSMYADTVPNRAVAVFAHVGVPLFFLVNGALLFSKPLDIKKHYIKTGRVFLILECWKFISLLVMSTITGQSVFADGRRAVFLYFLGGSLPSFGTLGYFWFMDALIGIYLLFPVFKICFDAPSGKKALGILVGTVCGFSALVVLLNYFGWLGGYLFGVAPLQFDSIREFYLFVGECKSYMLIYFIGGGLFGYVYKQGYLKRFGTIPVVLVIMVSYILMCLTQVFEHATLGSTFSLSTGYWLPWTIALTFALFYVFSNIEVKSRGTAALFETLGSNTLGIYFTHLFLIMLVNRYLAPILGPQGFLVSTFFLLLIYGIALAISVTCRRIPLVRVLFKL